LQLEKKYRNCDILKKEVIPKMQLYVTIRNEPWKLGHPAGW
jgi:hypothetical protein